MTHDDSLGLEAREVSWQVRVFSVQARGPELASPVPMAVCMTITPALEEGQTEYYWGFLGTRLTPGSMRDSVSRE